MPITKLKSLLITLIIDLAIDSINTIIAKSNNKQKL